MIVFFSEQQFFDLIRFGTVAENFSKASIDILLLTLVSSILD
jgi:hypothetical protein